jgi:hypothetical protein
MSDTLATIAYQAEAHDTAADALWFLADRQFNVRVIPAPGTLNGHPFEATVYDVVIGDDGQYKLQVDRRDDGRPGPTEPDIYELDIYDEIERVEVI